MTDRQEIEIKKECIQLGIDKLERGIKATQSPIIRGVYEEEKLLLENWKASIKPQNDPKK